MEEQAREMTVEKMPKVCSNTCHSISPRKEGVAGNGKLEEKFSFPTPAKTVEPSRPKSKEELTELPHKFEALLEFFDRMTSSLRLLSLRSRTPSFHNISSQVEILTGRKFLFMHLAQIKYILPEAVRIDKILTHEETTKCMKSDITITLQFDIVKDHRKESVFLALRNLFSSRLRRFYNKHPQDQLPQAVLPEPFNQRSITFVGDSIDEGSSTFCAMGTINSSHLPPNFKRCFYQKATSARIEETDLISPAKSPCDANLQNNVAIENPKSLPGISVDSIGESTPVKLFSESSNVFVKTPVQSTPTRSVLPTKPVLSFEDDNKVSLSQNSMQSGSSAKKSLDFYSLGSRGTICSQKQKSVGLSELVLLIHQIFESVNFCSITKEELVQKVLMNHLEIDDCMEIEMQMEHLEKLVPHWFHKKLTPSGDLVYKVKKVSDLNSVCENVKKCDQRETDFDPLQSPVTKIQSFKV